MCLPLEVTLSYVLAFIDSPASERIDRLQSPNCHHYHPYLGQISSLPALSLETARQPLMSSPFRASQGFILGREIFTPPLL